MNTLTTEQENTSQTSWLRPRTDIFESENGYFLESEMPGVSKEGLQITVDNQELTLIGRRKTLEKVGEEVYRESNTLPYKRVFDLDVSIDTSKITATVEQGVVKLTLPKAENLKPRQISVD